MKVKELFEVIDTKIFYPDILIIDDANSGSVKSFKYPRDDKTYINKMLKQFGNRTIVPHEIVFGTDDYGINYIIIKVK